MRLPLRLLPSVHGAIFVLAVAFAVSVVSGCGGGGGDPGPDGGGGNTDGGEEPARYALFGVTGAAELNDLSLAVGPDGRVGVAWFDTLGPQSGQSGVTDYAVRYREWRDGAFTDVEDVAVVQLAQFGIDLAFDPDGHPSMTFLGGDNATQMGGTSVFWHQSDAVIARRRSSGAWEVETVARFSDDAPAGNNVSDNGYLVGLYAQLAYAGGQTFLAWRDSHGGQNQQDAWAGSDLEMAVGNEGAWAPEVVIEGGKDKQGFGGHAQMVIAQGRPAIVSDRILGGPSAIGSDVVFSRKREDGTWDATVRPFSFTVGNTGTGPKLAHDPVLGFAIAVVDRSDDSLWFTRSVNEGANWSEADPVFQSGSGGWYPSLSVHPATHEPSIAFYVCGRASGIPQGSCPEREDELLVTERRSGLWREHLVDAEGGFRPDLAHLPDGRRVLAYRNPRTGALNLAVER